MVGVGLCKLCLRAAIGRPSSRSLSTLEEPQAGGDSDEEALEVRLPGSEAREALAVVQHTSRAGG